MRTTQRLVCEPLLLVAFATALHVNGNAYAQRRLVNHSVFDKYASPEQLRMAVDEFKREHAEEYEAAWKDFTLAVAFVLDAERPQMRHMHVIRKWVPYFPPLRPGYESVSDEERLAGGRNSPEWVAFCRRHVEELTLEYTPALRMVALGVLLDGWTDWSHWNTDRLQGYKERYPDIERIAALNTLRNYDAYTSQVRARAGETEPTEEMADASGLLLRMLIDPTISDELRKRVGLSIGAIHQDMDALDFVVKAYLATDDAKIRYQCGVMQTLSESLTNQQRLDFWLPYLDHPDTGLRKTAVAQVGNSRRRPRDVPMAEHPDREVVARLRSIAENDPDSQVRQQAAYAIGKLEDDSPPRGLITYDKDE